MCVRALTRANVCDRMHVYVCLHTTKLRGRDNAHEFYWCIHTQRHESHVGKRDWESRAHRLNVHTTIVRSNSVRVETLTTSVAKPIYSSILFQCAPFFFFSKGRTKYTKNQDIVKFLHHTEYRKYGRGKKNFFFLLPNWSYKFLHGIFEKNTHSTILWKWIKS